MLWRMRCGVSTSREAELTASRPAELTVEHLTVSTGRGTQLVRDVSFAVGAGEALGLVGESGSGKTLTCRAILRVLPPTVEVAGRIEFEGRSLLDLTDREMQAIRGSAIAMIFQDPMTALNPLLRVGASITQVIRSHSELGRGAAAQEAVKAMERVGIRNAPARASAYPHEFSGGMRQRVLTAMAAAGHPRLLLADEPTTALDVIVQAGILEMFRKMQKDSDMSLLLVSHDFGVVAQLCDRIAVMYAGQIVEYGKTDDVLFSSRHPYTIGLINSMPSVKRTERLQSIPGSPPEAGASLQGCAFAPRCTLAVERCRSETIPLLDVSSSHRSRCIRIDALHQIKPLRSHNSADKQGPDRG